MSQKIEYVLELTKEEALALVAVLADTTRDIGYSIYSALTHAYGRPFTALVDARKRFPDRMTLR